ncbi:hypothetical protein NM688_g977 [Phlebia brevispora]|uniref:Uncharacterized protein n=1 Tax=Phlebia brevispora TaxID=194682 RepID=A0ACC1TCI0_9APHY|nr:hypothetical protein NM688_g977 [Phlebia brevispora]
MGDKTRDERVCVYESVRFQSATSKRAAYVQGSTSEVDFRRLASHFDCLREATVVDRGMPQVLFVGLFLFGVLLVHRLRVGVGLRTRFHKLSESVAPIPSLSRVFRHITSTFTDIGQRMDKLADTPPADQSTVEDAEIGLARVPWPKNPKLRPQWYGWEFDDAWLMELGRNALKRDPTCAESDESLVQISMDELRREVGIPHLDLEIAYPGDSEPWKRVTGYFSILAIIGYHRGRISKDFRRRPTQAQVDKLTALTGGPPKWFIDTTAFW